MRSTLDRIILCGLADKFSGFDVNSARVAFAAIVHLDAHDRAKILKGCTAAQTAVTKDAAPAVDELEAMLGLLFFESSSIGWKAEPEAVIDKLRERRANEPDSIAQRILQWRSWGFRKAVYSYQQVPSTMRAALDRMLVEGGHAPLHDHPDPLTFAKGLTHVIVGGHQMPPDTKEYAALSEQDLATLVQAIVESKSSALYQSSSWFDWSITQILATQLDAIRRHLPQMAHAQVVYPEEMYWEAGRETAEALLGRVLAQPKSGWPERVALCWTRDLPAIRKAIQRVSPGADGRALWNKNSMRPANAELLEGDTIRELGLRECRRIVSPDNDMGLRGIELTLFAPGPLECPGCSGNLPIILDLDLRLPEFTSVAALAADPAGARRLRLAGCAVCAYYHDYGEPRVFSRFDWNGNVLPGPNHAVSLVLHSHEDFAIGLASNTKAWLLREPLMPIAPRIHACGHGSCIGGFPDWEQDVDYPTCVECNQTMLFIGSVSMLDLANADPSIYAFICAKCLLSTLTVQTS